MTPDAEKAALLAEIERLKREKPVGWKQGCRDLLKSVQYLTEEDDLRVLTVNGDKRGYEMIGRKCRSTQIQPPF